MAKRLAVAPWKLERGAIKNARFAKMGAVMDDFERPPRYSDDDTDTSRSNIRSKARCHQMRHGLDLLVIDFLSRFPNAVDALTPISIGSLTTLKPA